MAGKYAARTDVPVAKSRIELEAVVKKYGGDRFSSVWLDDQTLAIGFRLKGYFVRFDVRTPTERDPAVGRTPGGQPRTGTDLARAIEQEERRR